MSEESTFFAVNELACMYVGHFRKSTFAWTIIWMYVGGDVGVCTWASVREVRVARVTVQALADIARSISICCVGTKAVAAEAGVVLRRRLSFCRTQTVPSGEIEHHADALGKPIE